MTEALPPLPPQPAGVEWPLRDWPTGPLPAGVDGARLLALLDFTFSDAAKDQIGETHALLVIQGGRLLAERYGEGFGPQSTCWSWSMAKSVTQALVGIAVGDGLIDIHAPADVPEWRAQPDDLRVTITLDLLLRMSSGLAFVENYTADGRSDVREMLWGAGRPDTAAFAAAFPLEHAPGDFFSYSSGTSNIVSRCVARAVGASGEAFAAFMRERLFEPIGMTSPIPKFDAAGTFIGSSFCFATPRDFARFGLLYLRGGVWDGRRILPDGWVDYARTPTWQQPAFEGLKYGAHWWLGMAGPGTFSANGFDGQHVILDPARDLIVVRHGVTPEAQTDAMRAGLGEIVGCFR
jgi:CubicO group peptidase (beta-lactamase class C family)